MPAALSRVLKNLIKGSQDDSRFQHLAQKLASFLDLLSLRER